MTSDIDVYVLKVDRILVGRFIPFDKMYFVKFEDRRVIKRLFPYSIVTPVTDTLQVMLNSLPQRSGSTREFTRNDSVLDVVPKLNFDDSLVMVVPLLLTKVPPSDVVHKRRAALGFEEERLNGGMSTPRYLTDKGWRKPSKVVHKPEILSAMSYLQTPEQAFRPICVVCPRYIQHQDGGCKLGEPVCYRSLGFSNVDPVEALSESEYLDGVVHADNAG